MYDQPSSLQSYEVFLRGSWRNLLVVGTIREQTNKNKTNPTCVTITYVAVTQTSMLHANQAKEQHFLPTSTCYLLCSS